MAAFQVNVNGLPRPVDGNGNVYPSGTLTFYQAGATSTTINVYAEQALTTNLRSTITASGDGLFPDMWVDEDYRVVLKNKDGVIQWTRDVSSSIGTGAIGTAQLADGAVTLPKLLALDDQKFIVGQPGGNAQVQITGDVAVSNTGSSTVNSVQANAVDTAGIQNDAVITAKIPDSAITTAKINDASVTSAKLATDFAVGIPIYLATVVPTASNEVVVDLSTYRTTYRDLLIKVRDVSLDIADIVRARFSNDGGSTYITANYYTFDFINFTSAIGYLYVSADQSCVVDSPITADIHLKGIGGSDTPLSWEVFTSCFRTFDTKTYAWPYYGFWQVNPSTTDPVDTIKFYTVSGNTFNVTGTIEIFGIL